MRHPFRHVLIPVMAVLAAVSGCVSNTPEPPRTTPDFPLQKALLSARKKHLDVNAFTAVRQQAAEFRNHERRFYLADLIREEQSRSVSPETASRLLEEAISYNHLLGGGEQGADPLKLQTDRSSQLLDLTTASAAVRLGAAMQLYDSGDTDARQDIHNYEMELRNLTGADPQELARLNLNKLPKPFQLKEKLVLLQQFAAFRRPESAGTIIYPELLDDLKQLYRNDPRLPLLYAAKLYEFHTILSGRNRVDAKLLRSTTRLANAVGITLQIEQDLILLNKAYDACRLLELKLKLSKNPPPELQREGIRLTRQWHLAWLKLRTDLGLTDFDLPLPSFPEQSPPELSAETALFFEIVGK